jgi:hypothetical protein
MSFDQLGPSLGSYDEKKYGDIEKASVVEAHLAVADEKYRTYTYPAGACLTLYFPDFHATCTDDDDVCSFSIADFDAHDLDGVQRRLHQRHVQM